MPRAGDYKKLTTVQHVLKRPDLYMGSVKRNMRKEWHMTKETVSLENTDIPLAMIQLFKEIRDNVADNAQRSREEAIDPGQCWIEVKDNKVTVTNEGTPIMLDYQPEYKAHIPQTIFGDMLSGSNFSEVRNKGGANGIGAKGTNILSIFFSVTIKNHLQRKSYHQEWTNNTSKVTDPVIGKYKGTTSTTTISYIIDHKRFGYTKDVFKYPPAAIHIFRWIAASLSFVAHIPVTFNGQQMNYDLESYARLFGESDKYFTYIDDTTELIVMDTPGAGRQLGFANYIINSNGGAHVKAPLIAVKEYLAKLLKPAKSKDTAAPKTTVRDLKNHLTVIVSVTHVEEAEWGGGQTKPTFEGPMHKLDIPADTLKCIKTWSLPNTIKAAIDYKAFAQLNEETKHLSKGKYLKTKRGEDATDAGTKNGYLCDLYVVEGDSAEGYVADLLDFLPDGRKRNGTLTLRGKPLNCLKHCSADIYKNGEIQEIIRRLGAKPGIDYTEGNNIKKLRYGRFVLMTDSDKDGCHIKSLLLACLYTLFPTLLQCKGFVVDYMTPCARVSKGKVTKKFYFDKEVTDWESKTPDHAKWEYKYFKGLGSSTREHIEDDENTKRVIKFIADDPGIEQLVMALNKDPDIIKQKQEWIRQWDPECVEAIKNNKLPLSKFVDQFLRNYSHHTLSRHISDYRDGLTTAKRKCLYMAFKYWGRQCTVKKLPRVPDYSGTVCEKTHYHHADVSSTIIGLAQDFIGSNNIALLIGEGRFGSMEKGGKHASQPRYLKVSPSPLLPYIFREEDDALMSKQIEEGFEIEPYYMLPIIPLSLINGIDAVATGWRSKIPNYHPMEVIDAYLARLEGKSFTELVPWYRGYRGDTYLENGYFYSRGILEEATDDSYTLTCLPVGVWNNKYKKRLMDAVLAGEIKDFTAQCSATKTYFEVKGMHVLDIEGKPRAINEDDIGLVKKETLSNLTLLNARGVPMTYGNIKELLEDFYQFRLPHYNKRKQHLIEAIRHKIKLIKQRKAYIQAIIGKKLQFVIKKQSLSKEEVLAKIEELGLEPGFYVSKPGYSTVKPHEYTQASLKQLDQQCSKLNKEIKVISDWEDKQMWRQDLLFLKEEYIKKYGDDERPMMF